MKLNRYTTVAHAVEALKRRGFRSEYKLTPNGMMRNVDNGNKYSPDEMEIIEYHRFEGMSNPGDMSIVFAIEANDGEKGTVISSYGAYADIKLIEFMDQVKIKERQTTDDS